MLVYAGTVLIIAQIVVSILAFVKKQKKIRLVSLCLAVLAIAFNAGLAVYYNDATPPTGGLGLNSLGDFVIAFLQTIAGGVLFIIMAIGFGIQGLKNRKV